MADRECYCGSGSLYSNCCGPLLAGSRSALTAEALMRSRYTANAVRDVQYLLQSWHPTTRPQAMNPLAILAWQGLCILKTEQGLQEDRHGMVEFRALYEKNNKMAILHERSRFVRENGCWLYVDGELVIPGDGIKGAAGRNAPCPCGSGRKYKKCCLK